MNKWLRKARFYWWRFTYDLKGRMPFFCPRCRRWVQARQTAGVIMTTGHWVRICRECKTDLYEPWS